LICNPRECCGGADEAQADCRGDEVREIGDSVDFSKDESCGIEVRTCSANCTDYNWRVKLTEDCNTHRPPDCCLAKAD